MCEKSITVRAACNTFKVACYDFIVSMVRTWKQTVCTGWSFVNVRIDARSHTCCRFVIPAHTPSTFALG
jgi:predicted transglutaminase-like protease